MIKDTNLAAYANRFGAYTELRLQQNTNTRIGLLNGDVTTNARSVDSGVSARVFQDGIWGFASRADVNPNAIEGVVVDATKNAACETHRTGNAHNPKRAETPAITEVPTLLSPWS